MNLYRDTHYTFRFADDRLVPRFHLEGVEAGCGVTVFSLTDDKVPARVLAKTRAGADGWVELAEPLVVRAGGGFVAVPTPVYTIRDEVPSDAEGIRLVNRRAFGGDAEADLIEALRAGGYVRTSLVAECAGRIVGHVLFSDLPIITESGTVHALALAPMAVLPEFQNLGVGSQLVATGLNACRERGHRIVVVLGHPAFYPRFGFSSALAAKLRSPFSGDSFMAAELVPGALTGVTGRVEYTPPFGAWV
ncbi:N-acetyltransferase [Gemmata sp. G18]|uniref:N-acetyltransferase n=1 Tax=Gemmata palustris TaxID=2822762 RepID=A0ABS5BR14_9BACT|nr:N-acetyltransferase [Gemmata palustris]MBP3956163.1 N-acetyltransferase [Gemmata palustris]